MAWSVFLPFLSLATLLSAGLTILGYYLRPPRRALIYLCKPLTTILILLIAVLPGAVPADPYALAIGLGLGFSLLGDIWAMLSRRHFLKALISFLITHVCYVLAFLSDGPSAGFLWTVFLIACIGAVILACLWPGLSAGMKAAVGAYVGVIVIMVALASARVLAHASVGTLFAATGAFLFLASDAVLAVNRFRRAFRAAQAVILSTYFLGQLLIALSAGLRSFP